MLIALRGMRERLVRERRSYMAKASAARRSLFTEEQNEWLEAADYALASIRSLDARIGLITATKNSVAFHFDLRDPDLVRLGFGLNERGHYPAL